MPKKKYSMQYKTILIIRVKRRKYTRNNVKMAIWSVQPWLFWWIGIALSQSTREWLQYVLIKKRRKLICWFNSAYHGMIDLKERVFFLIDDVVIDNNDVNACLMAREFNKQRQRHCRQPRDCKEGRNNERSHINGAHDNGTEKNAWTIRTTIPYRGGLQRSQLLVAISLFCARTYHRATWRSVFEVRFFSLRLFTMPPIQSNYNIPLSTFPQSPMKFSSVRSRSWRGGVGHGKKANYSV